MELILIDSGLVNKVGHHYMLDKAVSGALARQKLRYRIFAQSGLEPSIVAEIGAIPHFSRSPYECVLFSRSEKRLRSFAAIFGAPAGGSPYFSERQSWKALNETFERDLEALPADVWQKDNLIVVMTITQNQILGLVRFLRAMPRDRASPRRLQFDASAKLSVVGGGFGAWGKILPRRLQAGGAADRPRSLLYRGKRSDADTVSQGLRPPDAHFADPF